MKPLIILTIVGVILSIWCSTAHADRLYTWEDDKGVTHITKEPPPQKTKLKDTMDYTVPPAQKNQATGKQVLNEGESSQPQRSEARERKKVSGAKEETEEVEEETGEVDEDVYYDSDGGRYTRRAIRQERKEARENRREDVRPATRERRQFHRRKWFKFVFQIKEIFRHSECSMKNLFVLEVSVIFILLTVTPALALMWGNDLVSVGDTKYEVLKKCGQPAHKEFLGVAEAKKYTRKVKTGGDVKVEVWIYEAKQLSSVSRDYQFIFVGLELVELIHISPHWFIIRGRRASFREYLLKQLGVDKLYFRITKNVVILILYHRWKNPPIPHLFKISY